MFEFVRACVCACESLFHFLSLFLKVLNALQASDVCAQICELWCAFVCVYLASIR